MCGDCRAVIAARRTPLERIDDLGIAAVERSAHAPWTPSSRSVRRSAGLSLSGRGAGWPDDGSRRRRADREAGNRQLVPNRELGYSCVACRRTAPFRLRKGQELSRRDRRPPRQVFVGLLLVEALVTPEKRPRRRRCDGQQSAHALLAGHGGFRRGRRAPFRRWRVRPESEARGTRPVFCFPLVFGRIIVAPTPSGQRRYGFWCSWCTDTALFAVNLEFDVAGEQPAGGTGATGYRRMHIVKILLYNPDNGAAQISCLTGCSAGLADTPEHEVNAIGNAPHPWMTVKKIGIQARRSAWSAST